MGIVDAERKMKNIMCLQAKHEFTWLDSHTTQSIFHLNPQAHNRCVFIANWKLYSNAHMRVIMLVSPCFLVLAQKKGWMGDVCLTCMGDPIPQPRTNLQKDTTNSVFQFLPSIPTPQHIHFHWLSHIPWQQGCLGASLPYIACSPKVLLVWLALLWENLSATSDKETQSWTLWSNFQFSLLNKEVVCAPGFVFAMSFAENGMPSHLWQF